MQLSSLLSTGALLAALAASTSLTITIPSSNILPNPHALPATSHATLTTLPSSSKNDHIRTASLTRSSTFIFRDLPAGSSPESYLLDIRAAGEYAFAPYRVDVAADGSILGVWETFRGNPWDNRGTERYVRDATTGAQDNVVVEAKVLGRISFYQERSKFSPLSLFKNPMILMAVVALGITFGMPKLMENMDPETRAEFEQQSRSSPLTGATGNAMAGGGFDLAGWMAGTSRGPMANAEAAHGGATGREASGSARKRG